MTPLKSIIFFTPYFPPAGGGLERYAFEISDRLKTNFNWRVVIVTSGERYGQDKKEDINGITIYRLSYKLKISNTPFSFKWLKKIKDIIIVERPDIINIHTPVPGIGDLAVMSTSSIPIVVTYHMGSMKKGFWPSDLYIWLYENTLLRILLSRARYIICVSDYVRLGFLKRLIYKSKTITPAVNAAIFIPLKIKKEINNRILFVGGLSKAETYKGLSRLFMAVKTLTEEEVYFTLTVVGEGNMKETYLDHVKELKLENKVIFLGRLIGEDLVSAYQNADIFVLPTSLESFGIVILEAMASGLPVVSTNVGVIPSLVKEGKTGYLVDPYDISNLTNKLRLLLDNSDRSSFFGKNGREKILGEFNWDDRAKEYDTLLRSLEK